MMDIRTTVMIAAVLALIVGVSLRFVLADYPASLLPSIRVWVLGTLILPTAWILYALRGSIPDLLSIVIANGLLGLAFATLVEALRCFFGRPPNRVLIYGPVAAIVACELIFTYIEPSMRLRGVTVSAIIGVQLACGVAVLLRQGQPRRNAHLLTAAAFATLMIALFARALYEGLRALPMSTPFASTPMQAIVFSLGAVFPVAATLGFLLMCNDRLYQELRRFASVDVLTGLNNRRTFTEAATNAIASARGQRQGLAMLMLDADNFKGINDLYGHAAGDEALRVFAGVLKDSMPPDSLLGRLGGEEFVAILPQADAAAALAHAERIRLAIENTQFAVRGEPVPLRVSIGIAILEPQDDFASLLRRADHAMYAAKRAGRNRVHGPHSIEIASATG